MTHEEYLAEERLKFYVKDSQIYNFYFGDITIGKKYVSPLRDNDPNPSLVFRYFNNKLYWKDFGLSNASNNDSVGFVRELISYERSEAVSRSEVVSLIYNDLVVEGKAPKGIKRPPEPLLLPYEVNWEDLNKEESEYWLKMGLYKKDTDLFNIKGVRGFYRNCRFIRKSMPDDPMFVYLTKERDTFKVYRPYALDKTTKFRGQLNGHILEGWEALPITGDILFINSSLKDTAVIRKAGYFGINPTSENSFTTLLNKAKELNNRFKRKIIFFDNDDPGIIATKKLRQELEWETCTLPLNWAKDPSDLVMRSGNYFDLNRFLDNVLKLGLFTIDKV